MQKNALKLSLSLFAFAALTACGASSATVDKGASVAGPQDDHCAGQTLNPPSYYVCPAEAQAGDSNSTSMGANASDYGATMDNSQGDDDDCKYHVSWSVNTTDPNQDAVFSVRANWLYNNTALTGAYTYAEVFLSDTHPAPVTNQQVVESPPGNYTIFPIRFDASGQWTVRFHFYEDCNDADNSLHGHAAFYVNVP